MPEIHLAGSTCTREEYSVCMKPGVGDRDGMLHEMFEGLVVSPPDPILGVSANYVKDPSPQKVNLSVGAYRDDQGKPYVFRVVKKVEQMMLEDPALNHEYIPIDGIADLKIPTQKLLFGDDARSIAEGRIASIQSLSGTGALRLAADLIKMSNPQATFFLTNPSWENHEALFTFAGFKVEYLPYWDAKVKKADISAFLAALKDRAKPKDVLVLHACAHNPTGQDPSPDEWKDILDAVTSLNVMPVMDCAYQGYASGDFVTDGFSLRLFESNCSEMIVTQSFAKNLGMYGERIGMMHAICTSDERAAAVLSQLKVIARRLYSSPSLHGGAIVSRILNDRSLKNEWLAELSEISKRVQNARAALRKGLEAAGAPGTWDHITNQIGMFSYTGLSEADVNILTGKYHIYLLKSGRISVAGLNTGNLDYVCRAITEVLMP